MQLEIRCEEWGLWRGEGGEGCKKWGSLGWENETVLGGEIR